MTEKIRILKADVPTKNGRRYSREVLELMVLKINDPERPLFGELGNPAEGQSINLDKVSHVVKNAHIDNDGWLVCTLEVLNTPDGAVLNRLRDEEPECGGFRPRGIGNVDKDGNVRDYQMVTIDYVANPA